MGYVLFHCSDHFVEMAEMLRAELMHDLEVSVQITMGYTMHMIHFVKKDIPTLFKTIKWYEQLQK